MYTGNYSIKEILQHIYIIQYNPNYFLKVVLKNNKALFKAHGRHQD